MPRPLPLRRIVKPCHFRHLPSHLPPIFSTLARPSLNPFPCYLFPPAGGRVPLVYPERSRRVNQPSLFAVDCRLSVSSGPLLLSPLFPLHTDTGLVSLLFPLLTPKQGGVPPRENVGAPTFLIFPVISRTFLALSMVQRVACYPPAAAPSATLRAGGGRYKTEEGGLKPPLQGKRGTEHGPRPILRDTGHGPRINLHRLALSLAEGSLATGH